MVPPAPLRPLGGTGPGGASRADGPPSSRDRGRAGQVPVRCRRPRRPRPATAAGAEVADRGPTPANGHIPAVATLSIPGFDALSASQVVQRLDGLNRSELVSVRAYESSTRGRRTILSRVDQLLDERS